jgi:hypothetical protein
MSQRMAPYGVGQRPYFGNLVIRYKSFKLGPKRCVCVALLLGAVSSTARCAATNVVSKLQF